MAWTYGSNPADSELDAVRLAIGDTDPEDQQIEDSAILYFISRNPDNIDYAAADTAEALQAKYARMSLEEVGDLAKNLQAKAENYMELAKRLRVRAESKNQVVAVGPSTADSILDKSPKFIRGSCYTPTEEEE